MGSLIELVSTPAAGIIHVVIESPRGATAKIKYDSGLGAFTLSRPLPLGLWYPHDWGFVPGTVAEDGDPLDALLLSDGTTFPGLVVRARPLGVIQLEQDAKTGGRERNDRLIAVADNAPRIGYRTAGDLPERVRQELEQFFLDVTYFEHKNARVLGWQGPEEALALVQRVQARRRAPGAKVSS
jgi:inorganic pyrophosphatase